ncbi:MAG: TerC family protein [Proteobacteria bacterium]|nr:TerC family protein [Pseudomonadota bacterium]
MGGMTPAQFWPALVQIMVINVILSGDNAVVIALACRSLPKNQRLWGIVLGALVAVVMRVVFTVGVATLLTTPWLKVIGSVLLLWIAVKLLAEDGDGNDIAASSNIWGAVRTIAVADLVMSLDNVLAIAAAAKGNWGLIILGLAISVPLIVFGATLVMWLLTRIPALVWVGAALLGWIAGEMAFSDPVLEPIGREWVSKLGWPYEITFGFPVEIMGTKFPLEFSGHTHHVVAAILGALFVVIVGGIVKKVRSPATE